MPENKFETLEAKIKFTFKNQDLLKEALTHRSYLNENPNWPLPHNERLEFLGDAVLELAVTEVLYRDYPDLQEGQLTLLRAALVNYQFLAKVAQEMKLQDYLYLSKGEAKDSSRAKEVILANAIEALIGSMYLDQGFGPIGIFVKKFITPKSQEVLESGGYKDSKSLLQEFVQERRKITPSYKVLEEFGPDHHKKFKVGVYVGPDLVAEGDGFSKQEAELDAAGNALKLLRGKAGKI